MNSPDENSMEKCSKSNHRHGFSMMSVMMALAMLGFVGYGLSQFAKQSNNNRLANQQHAEVDNLRSLAKSIINSRNNCGLPDTGASAVINSSTSINFDLTTGESADEVVVGSLGGNQITSTTNFQYIDLNQMSLSEIKRPTNSFDGTAKLKINAVKKQKTGATVNVSESIPVQLKFSDDVSPSARIVGCFSDDGDVGGATESYLESNLEQKMDAVIQQNFDRYINNFIDRELGVIDPANPQPANPQTLIRIVNNPQVQEIVCTNIEGTQWDEGTGKCVLDSRDPAGGGGGTVTPIRTCAPLDLNKGQNYCQNSDGAQRHALCYSQCAARGYNQGGSSTTCIRLDGKDKVSCSCCTLQ
ncbi:hypothetical protein GW915_07065 [bacterium]|nr:hypothetical protein [bacterium]